MQISSLLTRISTTFLALSFLSVPALMNASVYAADRRSDNERYERRHDNDDDDRRDNRRNKWRKGNNGRNDRFRFSRNLRLRKSRNDSWGRNRKWDRRHDRDDDDNDRRRNRRSRKNDDRD